MKIIINNKSFHRAQLEINGKSLVSEPKQTVEVETENTEKTVISVSHLYGSYCTEYKAYRVVVNSTYVIKDLQDGQELCLAHEISYFKASAQYERFFLFVQRGADMTEFHSASSPEILFHLRDQEKKADRKDDRMFNMLFEPLVSGAGLSALIFLCLWLSFNFRTGVIGFFVTYAVVFVFAFLVEIIREALGKGVRRSRMRRKKSEYDWEGLNYLEIYCTPDYILSYYKNPNRKTDTLFAERIYEG
ncbi:MAG: hypothetical protein J1F23_03720 [Oscillospiraceae bacterium]|nr:hypothetical protein [Oscillospiraceae bacterium]